MATEKNVWKPLWLKALQEIFTDANEKGLKEIVVTALDVEHKAKKRGIVSSTCRAMRSIMGPGDKVVATTKSGNSTTFAVQYNLPNTISPEAYKSKGTAISKNIYEYLKIFEDSKTVKACLKKCEETYRLNDEGRDLYKKAILYSGDRFSDDFINIVYNLLEAWDMNVRGAKLQDRKIFITSIKQYKPIIKKLAKKTILDIEKPSIMDILKELFYNLDLVSTNTKIVTFAKAMHMFFPNLIVPIDRKYTCNFFHIYFDKPDKIKKTEEQWEAFKKVEVAFSKFANGNDLSKYLDPKSDWNINILKIMDNMIIGYIMLYPKKEPSNDIEIDKPTSLPKPNAVLIKRRKPLPDDI